MSNGMVSVSDRMKALTRRVKMRLFRSESEAKKCVEEWTKWMALLMQLVNEGKNRWDYSVPALIDVIWHEAILDTAHYTAMMCQCAVSHNVPFAEVHHDPDAAFDSEDEKEKRRANLTEEFKRKWKLKDEEASREQTLSSHDDPLKREQSNAGQSDEIITLTVKRLTGEQYRFRVRTSSTVQLLCQAMQRMMGTRVDDFRMIFRGRQLEHGRKLSEYNIGENAILHCLDRLKGC